MNLNSEIKSQHKKPENYVYTFKQNDIYCNHLQMFFILDMLVIFIHLDQKYMMT